MYVDLNDTVFDIYCNVYNKTSKTEKKILKFHIKLSKHRTHSGRAHTLLPYFAIVLHRQMPDGASRNTKYVKRNELKITKNGTKKNTTAKSHVRKRIFYSYGRMQQRTAIMVRMRG